MEELKCYCSAFDYIRFTFADINGTARGKNVPSRSVEKFLENGVEIYAGVFAFGIGHEIPLNALDADVVQKCHVSCKLLPVPETFHPVPWASEKEGAARIAEVYCQPTWIHNDMPMPAPRNIASNMLKQLGAIGYELLSGTEFEFKLFKNQSLPAREPLFPLTEYCSTLRFSLLEELMFHLDENLHRVGVELENLMCEYSPGQFEFVQGPIRGMEGADKAFLFKQGVLEMALKKGFFASFMGKADGLPGAGSGAHFNFSLWKTSDGSNAFYDSSSPDKLSDVAKHWIAGLIKHGPALSALCCPTVNCFRRMHRAFAPDLCDWNFFDRGAFVRAKTGDEAGTYLENRLPSSAANPYIVMAATIAAGIDGIKRKMVPPVHKDPSATKLPFTLNEAIDVLEADKDLAEILGPDFVTYFVNIKREIDLAKFGSHDMSKIIDDELNAEIFYYEIKP